MTHYLKFVTRLRSHFHFLTRFHPQGQCHYSRARSWLSLNHFWGRSSRIPRSCLSSPRCWTMHEKLALAFSIFELVQQQMNRLGVSGFLRTHCWQIWALRETWFACFLASWNCWRTRWLYTKSHSHYCLQRSNSFAVCPVASCTIWCTTICSFSLAKPSPIFASRSISMHAPLLSDSIPMVIVSSWSRILN